MLNNYLYDFLSHVFRKDNVFLHVLYVHFRTLFVRMRTRSEFARFFYLLHNQYVIRMARFLDIKKQITMHMKMGNKILWLMSCLLFCGQVVWGEKLTLQEAIQLAQASSPEAEAARHTYRAAYWSYRSFRADYLPEVSLSASPYLNRQINKVTQPDGTELFLRQNQLATDLTLSVSQNVWFTGGNLFMQTAAQRMDELGEKSTAYNTQPFTVGYRQSLFGYNSLKWNRRIEPVRFQEAKKTYSETLELIASKTCELFFALASAQSDLEIARANYASADTLYRYARGRYRIGSITENEMLQLEVNKLTEETNLMKARISVEDAMLTFRSFLGIREEEEIEVVPHDSVPDFEVPLDKALEQAHFHSPEIETYRRMQLESRSQLASARASRGLKADLYLQFGLSQTAARLRDSYRDPLDQQYVSLSVVIPILDWGRGKGKVRVAKSNIELVNTQVEQGMNDFELNVRQMVRQFNLQARQVEVASRTDETARRRYEVALRLYLMGKSSVLDLNAATTEKDTSRRNYIEALKTYWMLYYGLRSLTQYDFYRNCPLTETLPEI
jgi:outer membrane protein TolC